MFTFQSLLYFEIHDYQDCTQLLQLLILYFWWVPVRKVSKHFWAKSLLRRLDWNLGPYTLALGHCKLIAKLILSYVGGRHVHTCTVEEESTGLDPCHLINIQKVFSWILVIFGFLEFVTLQSLGKMYKKSNLV